ncbi:MAG: GNAT family N-acetyltransferase [Actinomycetaceae bacterium]|nr:GNAT family N-acetyltransferase [Actinomycetaceae bacterium]
MIGSLSERLTPAPDLHYPGDHLGLVWRPLRARDAGAIARLIRSCEKYDDALSSTSERQIADLLEYGANGQIADVIVGLDSDDCIRSLAWVEVMQADSQVARADVNAFIEPQWRGRGIGRAVLKWQEARARQMIVDAYGPDATIPVRLANLVDSHVNDRRRLYMAAGFSPHRTFQIMHRDFHGEEPAVSQPSGGYTVVPWIPELDNEIKSLHIRAFSDHWGTCADTVEWWNNARPHMQKRWSFVALSSTGQVAGYILVCRLPARWIHTGVSEAYAELLGVDSGARGHGLAKALITKAMNAAFHSRVERFGLDVDKDNPHGAQSFYQRLGFVSAGEQVFYALDL